MAYERPGVYVREVPSQTQVSTQNTATAAAFLGTALRGQTTYLPLAPSPMTTTLVMLSTVTLLMVGVTPTLVALLLLTQLLQLQSQQQ